MKMKMNFDFKKINFSLVKDFYGKNRQTVLTAFVVLFSIFFVFYWTNRLISDKKSEYSAAAQSSYAKLEKTAVLASAIMQAESSSGKKMQGGLLSFVQTSGIDAGIGAKLVNIRPVTASGNIEHVALRMENLFYDELVNFVARIETFDNLRIKTLTFSRRYNDPLMIDATMEIVKS